MEDPKELPEKTSETENDDPKNSSAPAPVIDTPVPPQVMDPSAPPDIEGEKPATGKRKRNKLKHYVKLDT